ncbi:hypothetical protein MRB53_030094 [Persea americana]|uniref:Uncharacterized protein n=1 Tax=Persea americana TaxID=3435 RepID=A0ACC2KKM3_PERAE|nr:hypothetical protein MRB53_030094 [Persea americana]
MEHLNVEDPEHLLRRATTSLVLPFLIINLLNVNGDERLLYPGRWPQEPLLVSFQPDSDLFELSRRKEPQAAEAQEHDAAARLQAEPRHALPSHLILLLSDQRPDAVDVWGRGVGYARAVGYGSERAWLELIKRVDEDANSGVKFPVSISCLLRERSVIGLVVPVEHGGQHGVSGERRRGGEEAVGGDVELGDVESRVAEHVIDDGEDGGGEGEREEGLVDGGVVEADEAEDECLVVGWGRR